MSLAEFVSENIEYKYYLDRVLFRCVDWNPDITQINFTYLNKSFFLEVDLVDSVTWYVIAVKDIIDMPLLSDVEAKFFTNDVVFCTSAKTILQPFDVDAFEIAWKRIASTARPIKDPLLLRICCKRAVALHGNNYEITGLCICPVGYRILDLDLTDDPDEYWFLNTVDRFLNWKHEVKPAAYSRWRTSVLMVLGYYYMSKNRFDDCIKTLLLLIDHSAFIPYAALIQTNIIRSCFIVVDHYINTNQIGAATHFLRKIIEYTKRGIIHSDFLGSKNGYIKYSEVEVTIKAAREAKKLLDLIERGEVQDIREKYNLMELGGYLYVLEKRRALPK